jgi:hypothetical protein
MCVQDNHGIKAKPTVIITNSPQENEIIERLHKVVNDMFRSIDLENNNEDL